MARAIVVGCALLCAGVALGQAQPPPQVNPPAAAPAPSPGGPPAATPQAAAAEPPGGYTVSGRVTGDVIANVPVSLRRSGSEITNTTTGSTGAYSFGNVADGEYTVHPTLPRIVFSPQDSPVTVNRANATVPDITSKPPSYGISGTVLGDDDEGIPSIQVTLSRNGVAISAKTTGSNGEYEFSDLSEGTYAVTPALANRVFTPSTWPVELHGANALASFTARPATKPLYKIYGTVSGAGTSGVSITVAGANSGSALTTDTGGFSVPGLENGNYVVTPSAPGFVFNPASISVTVKDGDAQQNFSATATQCTPPAVSFRWVGTRGAYMVTNPRFAPTPPPAAASAPASSRAAPLTPKHLGCGDPIEPPSIRILDRRGECVAVVQDVRNYQHCGMGDSAGCVEQVYSVALADTETPLVDNGYRVSVEFTGIQSCSGKVRVEDVVVQEQHHLSIDVGSSFGLNSAGSFVSHLEAALNANSRWQSWLYGDVDLRLTSFEETSANGDPKLAQAGRMTLDTAGRALFGLTQVDAYQPWIVPLLGAGLRTSPGDVVDVRYRGFVGARLQVSGYNAGEPAESFGETRGFVEVGYAYDRFWDGFPHRVYTEGQLEIPSFGSKWVRLLVRGKIDRPIGPPGTPAEVRVSLLTSLNPSTLGTFLGFAPKKP